MFSQVTAGQIRAAPSPWLGILKPLILHAYNLLIYVCTIWDSLTKTGGAMFNKPQVGQNSVVRGKRHGKGSDIYS